MQKNTYIYSVHTVYYKDILSYQYTLYTVCIHYVHIVICEGATDLTLYNRLVVQQIVVQRCNRLYICNVMDVYCMVSSDSRWVVLVQCVRVVQWNCVNVQCMACCVSGSVM